jgi:hypothetical protein
MNSNSTTTTRTKKINTIEKLEILKQAMELVNMEAKHKGVSKLGPVDRVIEVYEKLIKKISST